MRREWLALFKHCNAVSWPGRLPFGRDAKRPSALLRALEREKPFPAARA
ncbi:MAG: hypothetical protein P8179_12105 [Candidatus Thiodiazotropha sp.]